ncbi:nitroreductase/quinone reductase family protein [Mycobacterium sp. NPDC048908]|uniref:nitroreductase/quinone reductase family protein n=1 Tax=Mycobacterium sp. NPDC048908 TaxID=3364292 RepID=UPI00372257B9
MAGTAWLATISRRSSRVRSPPRANTRSPNLHDGRDAVAIASNYGGPKHPQWYRNKRLISERFSRWGGTTR